ncbi:MAG TPA: ubiquitin carboxyl-terminal hydrolase family protein [Chlamydiales bacterium]|nr:ubiquitin carboxyl-terminal hydrolase family protein [Chlamydiales bacterium]
MSAVGATSSFAKESGICDFLISPKAKVVIAAIAQLAVKIFFIFSAVWMAGVLLPVAFHAVFLPMIALGATTLAAFFFQSEPPSQKAVISSPSLIEKIPERPIHFELPLPAGIPQNAPRGIYRTGMNCWVNSLVQLLECEPFVAQWLRTPIPLDLEPFIQYIAQYEVPLDIIQEFRAFHEELIPPKPVPDAFALFLKERRTVVRWLNTSLPLNYELFNQYVAREEREVQDGLMQAFHNFAAGFNPPQPLPNAFAEFLKRYEEESYKKGFLDFCDAYLNLQKILPKFNEFLVQGYDAAVLQRQAAVRTDSQMLREALSLIGPFDPSPAIQIDAGEAWAYSLELLPNSQKVLIYEENHYDVRGLIPLPNNPIVSEKMHCWGFILGMDPEEGAPDLIKLLENFRNDKKKHPKVSLNGKEQKYKRILKVTQIVQPPAVLRIHVNRVAKISPVQTWVAKVIPKWFPGMADRPVKLDYPIAVPQIFPLETQQGVANYTLVGFGVHIGELPTNGHYISYRSIVIDGRRVYFCQDDAKVTLMDQEAWFRETRKASQFCFLPV